MRKNVITTSFLTLALFTASARAPLPAVYTIEIDASGVSSESRLRTACQAIADFADLLFERARQSFAPTPDWLAVNLFGGPGGSRGSGYINCSDPASLRFLKLWLSLIARPETRPTAAWDLVRDGARDALDFDRRLPFFYLEHLILVTAGNLAAPSSSRVVSEVQELFPSERLHLFVIGTPGAHTAEFDGLADLTLQIEDYGALSAALREISLRPYDLPQLHAHWRLLE